MPNLRGASPVCRGGEGHLYGHGRSTKLGRISGLAVMEGSLAFDKRSRGADIAGDACG